MTQVRVNAFTNTALPEASEAYLVGLLQGCRLGCCAWQAHNYHAQKYTLGGSHLCIAYFILLLTIMNKFPTIPRYFEDLQSPKRKYALQKDMFGDV